MSFKSSSGCNKGLTLQTYGKNHGMKRCHKMNIDECPWQRLIVWESVLAALPHTPCQGQRGVQGRA